MSDHKTAKLDPSSEYVIGIDLGGTRVGMGAFTPDGERIDYLEEAIRSEEGPQAGLKRIAALVESLVNKPALRQRRLLGLGVGSTGPTDSQRGLLVNPGTMPGWINVPLIPFLQDRFGLPACLENDADAAALGEYWQGVGKPLHPEDKPVRRLYAITVGTGIGTSFILDGQVVRGADGFHPEGGHQLLDPSGPQCYCGGRGCWESLSSGTAIGRAARQAIEKNPQAGGRLLALAGGELERVDAVLTAEAARNGDPLAMQVIERSAQAFAQGVFNILMLFFPELIVLSGGVMRSGDLFEPALEAMLQGVSGYLPVERVRILPAKLGYLAGIYGAAYALLLAIDHPKVTPPVARHVSGG